MANRDDTKGQRLDARKIRNVMQSLTILDVDVSKLGERLHAARGQRIGGDAGACIIDITCCIIDCSRCSADDRTIYSNPANILDGFLFRLPAEQGNRYAPVYFVPQSNMAAAFRAGHRKLQVPDANIDAHLLGLAGDVLSSVNLEEHGIAATAPVVSLAPRAVS